MDGTLGAGGHAWAVLKESSPDGWLFGMDRDAMAVAAARARLAEFGDRVEIRQGNFSEIGRWVAAGSCDGVLLDLGVSSPQIDMAERGFSFQKEGPLDMRMDAGQKETAADLINNLDAEELARIFWELGGERDSRRLARAIERARPFRPFLTTVQLADFIEKESPRKGQKSHPATAVFQALRIEVNNELGSLREGLQGAFDALKKGGRLAVITFHSLEDRIVKDFGRKLEKDYTVEGEVDVPELRTPRPAQARWVQRKAILPGREETAQNPRARSAQLRVLEKLEAAA